MSRKPMFWLMALALAVPAFVSAQEGPGPEDEDEIEMSEPGPGGPGMGPGGPGMGMGPGGPGMGQGKGGPGMQVRKKRMMWTEGGEGEGPMEMEVQVRKMKGGGFMGEQKVLGVIKKHDPAFAAKLEDFRQAAPGKYKMVLQMSGKLLAGAKMAGDEALEKDAVRGLALEFESKELSQKYNKASDTEKKEIKARLGKVLGELFDLRSKGQELRVKHMEGELSNLKKKLESRKANKGKIVEQRLEQLTGEGYGW